MKRFFFFALLFPPALMDLMLVLAHPVSLPRYFLSGYVVAAVPALLVALVDEVLACQIASNCDPFSRPITTPYQHANVPL
ncbi:MAG: hypothetical protein NTV56_20875 [Alphaproteobacteria bacterium]|nr:hypothetical protein [Alphaproteobacteria bacterium]